MQMNRNNEAEKNPTNATTTTVQPVMDMGHFNVKGLAISPTVLTTAKNRYEAAVRVNEEPITWLANSIQLGIESSSYREVSAKRVGLAVAVDGDAVVIFDKASAANDVQGEVHEAEICDVFRACAYVAIGARVAQVSGMRTSFDKKNFELLALLFPIIASYGVYSNQEEAYDIIPVVDDELKNKLNVLGCFSKDGKFVEPKWYLDAMMFFRSQKLMTGYGLPKDTRVDSPMFFKLTMENDVVIGHPGANVAEVLIATLVSSSKLTDLFGAYRTLYCGISTVRSAIENIGLKALHDLSA